MRDPACVRRISHFRKFSEIFVKFRKFSAALLVRGGKEGLPKS